MLRKMKNEGPGRRARLDILSNEGLEDVSSDPIAAALEERKKKKEESLRAAAAAAAKRAAANLTTYFADDIDPAPSPAKPAGPQTIPPVAQPLIAQSADTNGVQSARALQQADSPLDEAESPAQPAASAEQVPNGHTDAADDSGNPLASLLGYSYDDGSGSEAGDDEAHETGAGGQPSAPASEDGDSNMDAELANFMEELESSGLLKEGDSVGQPSSCGEEQPDTAAPSGAPREAPSSSAPEYELQTYAEDSNAASAEAAAGTSASAQAEQRVLGSLEGCLGWHEVMDMGSGRVYFWCEDTNEVAWDPPEGSVPRSKQQNDATFAAAHAAPAAEPATANADDADSSMAAAEAAPGSAAPSVVDPGEPSCTDQNQSAGAAQPDKVHDEAAARSDQEEGEIEQELAADVERPAEEVGKAGEELLASSWEAAERMCGPVPLLVRLAVEVEVRLRDWRTFSDVQRRAAELGKPGEAHSWAAYQRSVSDSWRTLQAALPMALKEAESGLAAATAAIADASAVPAAASQPPQPEDGELVEPSSAAPQEPTTSAPAVHAAAAEPDQPVQLPPPASEEDNDVDMELDDTPAPPQPASKPQQTQATPVSAATGAGAAPINSAVPAASTAGGYHPPMLVPLPAPAPLWPGFYLPYMHYMHPRPLYAPQPLAVSTSAPVAQPEASAPALNASADNGAAPPLPADSAAQPPLPEEQPGGVQSAGGRVSPPAAAAQLRAKEYRAEPMRMATPPSMQDGADAGALQAPAGEEEKKRKREKAAVGTGPLAKKKKALKVGKTTSSLIDKWAAVRKDLVEEEEKDKVLDADALERKRLREAEEWRLKQLRAGVSSEDNSNFQPLAVDWREKMKATKAAAEFKRKPVSVKQSPVTYQEKPDLEALSVGLPAGWRALWDQTSKEVYYANPKTKETSWEKPI